MALPTTIGADLKVIRLKATSLKMIIPVASETRDYWDEYLFLYILPLKLLKVDNQPFFNNFICNLCAFKDDLQQMGVIGDFYYFLDFKVLINTLAYFINRHFGNDSIYIFLALQFLLLRTRAVFEYLSLFQGTTS